MPTEWFHSALLCQFLEISNRSFYVGLYFHQFSHGIFPDVSVSGCYYKKVQYKISQASWPVKEAGEAEECAFPKSLGHVLYKGYENGETPTLTSEQALEL